MTNSTIPDMKEIFKQAAEIAQQVPEIMQVAAFNRALDLLTGQVAAVSMDPIATNGNQPVQATNPTRLSQVTKPATTVDELVAAIDTTQHPAVASAAKVLDRSLMILQIALRSHNLDGLTPPEIARILTEKFRLSTTQAAVTMALGAATTLVNRVSRGRAYEYKIMGPGEEYLAHLGSNEARVTSSTRASSKPMKRGRNKTLKSEKVQPIRNASKPKSGRIGPKQMLEKLIADNYFSTPRDISQIIEHLQNNYARTYKNTDLSPTLTRLLREQSLEREKNEKGVFQYIARRKA